MNAVDQLGGQATRAEVQEQLGRTMEQRSGELLRKELDRLYAVGGRQLQRDLTELVRMGLLFEEGETNKRRYYRQRPH